MKTKILFITTLILFTFSGCSKPETKFYEKGGKTYFVDKNGDIFMVNFMFEGNDKANKVTATPDDVAAWYNKYPDPNVPVLADEYRFLHTWVKPTGLPCIYLVDENMHLINYTNRGLTDAFLYLTEPLK